jgi:hypothetical protein
VPNRLRSIPTPPALPEHSSIYFDGSATMLSGVGQEPGTCALGGAYGAAHTARTPPPFAVAQSHASSAPHRTMNVHSPSQSATVMAVLDYCSSGARDMSSTGSSRPHRGNAPGLMPQHTLGGSAGGAGFCSANREDSYGGDVSPSDADDDVARGSLASMQSAGGHSEVSRSARRRRQRARKAEARALEDLEAQIEMDRQLMGPGYSGGGGGSGGGGAGGGVV